MNKKEKFENFLESLKKGKNDAMIESIKKGFNICFEAEEVEGEPKRPIVGINKFVTRQTDPNFVGTTISEDQLRSIAAEASEMVKNNNLKDGYAPFVKIAVLKHPEILTPIVKITDQNEDKLVTEMTKRREGEDEYEHSFFPASSGVSKSRSDHVNVILYTREQLDKEGENPVGSHFDIITVNAEPYSSDSPMAPTTLKRNAGGKGGSGFQHSEGELSDAEKFWYAHAMVQ